MQFFATPIYFHAYYCEKEIGTVLYYLITSASFCKNVNNVSVNGYQ
jgi:hypothetical protein